MWWSRMLPVPLLWARNRCGHIVRGVSNPGSVMALGVGKLRLRAVKRVHTPVRSDGMPSYLSLRWFAYTVRGKSTESWAGGGSCWRQPAFLTGHIVRSHQLEELCLSRLPARARAARTHPTQSGRGAHMRAGGVCTHRWPTLITPKAIAAAARCAARPGPCTITPSH